MSLRAILNSARTLVNYERLQQILANNLANVSTDGYKADLFGLQMGPGDTAPVPISALDLRQGSLRDTGRDLDLALYGPGFFVVDTPGGERLTHPGVHLQLQLRDRPEAQAQRIRRADDNHRIG